MFRRVFVVHDHILRGRYGVVFGRIRTVFCYKTAVLTRPVLRVIDEAPYFRRIYVVTMPHYHRSPGCASRITDRVKTARITPFTCRILIVYGRLWIVPFNLGNATIVYGENMTVIQE